jgi:hypothetical protein
MLKIVEATFPSIDFEDSKAQLTAGSDNDGARLANLWSAVQSSLPKNRMAESEIHAALEALYEVGIPPRHGMSQWS